LHPRSFASTQCTSVDRCAGQPDDQQDQRWDLAAQQPLVVTADGGLYVVDGQHRLEAARQRSVLSAVRRDQLRRCRDMSGGVRVALNQRRKPFETEPGRRRWRHNAIAIEGS
jgi:hypothetical protein